MAEEPKPKEWLPESKEELPLGTEDSLSIKELSNRGFEVLDQLTSLKVGSGSSVFKVTNQGLWLGSEHFTLAPFSVSMIGNANLGSLNLSGGTVRYGKTSFSDDTNAGYILCPEGVYFGSAADATRLKFTLSSGTLDLIGTISGRNTAIIANALNSSGSLITDIVNARLDTSAKTILSDFSFGTADYAGALMSGDIVWNSTTGEISSGSGVLVYRKGIVGASHGSPTFSLDATTGDATFAGTLAAPIGTLGTLQIASGGHIRLGQTDYNAGKGFWLGDSSGTTKFSVGSPSGGEYLNWNGQFLTISSGDLQIVPAVGAGAPILVTAADLTTGWETTGTYTKVKELKCLRAGTFNVYFELNTNENNTNVYGRIYKNGVAFGTERNPTITSTADWPSFTEALAFNYGDLIQLYIKKGTGNCRARYFRLYVRSSMGAEVIQDS